MHEVNGAPGACEAKPSREKDSPDRTSMARIKNVHHKSMYWYILANNNSREELNMDNLLKLLGSLLVFSLLALPLTGCDSPPWESGMILNLKVDAPRDGTTVTTSTVTVSGRVTGTQSAGAKVTINGADVPVKDNKFSTSVTLTEGTNVIDIVADSGGAKPSQKVTVTYAPAK
jgi:hypothetical protein